MRAVDPTSVSFLNGVPLTGGCHVGKTHQQLAGSDSGLLYLHGIACDPPEWIGELPLGLLERFLALPGINHPLQKLLAGRD